MNIHIVIMKAIFINRDGTLENFLPLLSKRRKPSTNDHNDSKAIE